jgi:Amidohydrolase
VHQLIFSGVFERHPGLKLVLTEQNFDWWVSSGREFDSTYENHRSQLNSEVKRRPSEYMKTNIFIGASFIVPFEAEDAVANEYTPNVMWGRDYGHIEGTFVVTADDNPATNPGRLAMRHGMSGVPPVDIRQIMSDTAIDFYGLDRGKLQAIAERIKSPTLTELSTPVESIPENGGMLAFRKIGAWS